MMSLPRFSTQTTKNIYFLRIKNGRLVNSTTLQGWKIWKLGFGMEAILPFTSTQNIDSLNELQPIIAHFLHQISF